MESRSSPCRKSATGDCASKRRAGYLERRLVDMDASEDGARFKVLKPTAGHEGEVTSLRGLSRENYYWKKSRFQTPSVLSTASNYLNKPRTNPLSRPTRIWGNFTTKEP